MNVSDYIAPEQIKLNADVQNQEEVMRALVALTPLDQHSQNEVFRLAMEREKIRSTMLCGSVAMPHCRSDLTDRIILVALRSQAAIASAHNCDKSAQLFFLVIGPAHQPNEFLVFFSKLASICQRKDILQELMESGSEHTFFEVLKRLELD